MSKKTWIFDPRTGLVMLALSNVIAFSQNTLWIEFAWFGILLSLIFFNRAPLAAVKWTVAFALLIWLQSYVLPISPKMIATSFAIFANYARRMFPCLMVGGLMVKKTPLKNLIAAMRKMHFPEKLIISISVTLRYIPAIREETHHVRDAMKLRKIKGMQKAEALIVPLMISATVTAEELSAAAVTRGVENPAPKTSLVDLKMSALDWIYILITMGFLVVVFVVK